MVRMPDEARLEIVVENSVTSSEVNLRGVDNLDDQQPEEFAQRLKRQMMRKVLGKNKEQTPTLEEVRQKVAHFKQGPQATREVEHGEVTTGINAALRSRFADNALSSAAESTPQKTQKGKGRGKGQGKAGKARKQILQACTVEDAESGTSPVSKRPKRGSKPESSDDLEKTPTGAPTFEEIICSPKGLSRTEKTPATRLYHFRQRYEASTTITKCEKLEQQQEHTAKSACISLGPMLAFMPDFSADDLADSYIKIMSFAEMHRESDPLPLQFFYKLLSYRISTKEVKDYSAFLDPQPCQQQEAQPEQYPLPLALSDIPVSFLSGSQRLCLTSRLLYEEALCEIMPREEAAIPELLSLRSKLLPKISALSAVEEDEAAQAAAEIVSDCLLAVTCLLKEEPMTQEEMRVLSACSTDSPKDHFKVLANLMSAGWWKTQKRNAVRHMIDEVQHGPALLAAMRSLLENEAPKTWDTLRGVRGLDWWMSCIRPSACRHVVEAAMDNVRRRLASRDSGPEMAMAEANKILEDVTWLQGVVVGNHEIFGEEIRQKVHFCHSQASVHQLQKHKAVRLGAGVEACQHALSTAATEGFQVLKPEEAEGIRNSFQHCEGLRVSEPAEAKLVKDAAALCLQSVEDASLAADAATAALGVIEVPSEASDDHDGCLVLQMAVDAATCGNKLCSLIIEKPDCSAIGKLLEYHDAVQNALSAFQEARTKVEAHCSGPVKAMLRGWPDWLQGVSEAETLLKGLAEATAERAGKQVTEKVSSLMAGGKASEEGGSWKKGLALDAPWRDIEREMDGCFWSKPGVLRALEKGTQALGEAIEEYTNTCHRVGITPEEELLEFAKQKKSLALCTLTEEYMTSKIVSRDTKTPGKLKKRLNEIVGKFEYSEVHPTIRAKVTQLTTS